MSRAALLVPLALFAGLAIYLGAGLTRDPSRIPSTLINEPLPEFDLPPIDGRSAGASHADLEGRVALVNVFASWCIPCAIEHPVLMTVSRSEPDLLLAGINWKEKPGEGGAWLARHGDPYDVVGDDAEGRAAIDFGVTGAPETFIVDAKGAIRYKQVGPITEDIWARDIKPIVDRLQAEAEG